MRARLIVRIAIASAVVVLAAMFARSYETASLARARTTFTEVQKRLAAHGADAVTEQLSQVDAVLDYAHGLQRAGVPIDTIVSSGSPLGTPSRTFWLAFIDAEGALIALDPKAPKKAKEGLRSHTHRPEGEANYCARCLEKGQALFRIARGTDVHVAAVIPLPKLYDTVLARLRSGENGYAWMVGADGTILGAPDRSMIGRTLSPAGQKESFRDAFARMRQAQPGAGEYEWWDASGSSSRLAAWAPFKVSGLEGSVALSADTAELAALSGQAWLRRMSVLSVAGLAVAALFFVLFLSARERRRALEGATARVLKGQREAVVRTVAQSALEKLGDPLRVLEEADEIKDEKLVAAIGAAQEGLTSLTSLARPPADDDQTRFDVRQAISDAMDIVRPSASKIRWSLEAHGAVWVNASRGGLGHVLVHLLTNAARAAEEGGGAARVVVRAWTDGDRALVQVEDSGPGFDKAALERAVAGGPRGPRLGLGLAEARDIAARNGGSISVQEKSSGLGGAIVRLELPTA